MQTVCGHFASRIPSRFLPPGPSAIHWGRLRLSCGSLYSVPDWQLWCFFEALGLTSGALCHLPGLRPFLLKRQISGGELCCIASLLLPLLPNGFLLLHSQGSCFHFHGSNPVQSYLSLFLLLPARHSIPCFYGCFNQHNYIM